MGDEGEPTHQNTQNERGNWLESTDTHYNFVQVDRTVMRGSEREGDVVAKSNWSSCGYVFYPLG